jgi:drug/metabolite transporter (DMT)-like permease
MLGGGVLFLLYMVVRRAPIPKGRAFLATVAFGVVQFGFGFGLGYWALVKIPANVAGTLLGALPLFTLGIAAAARVEPLTVRGVAGSLVSIAGIGVLLSASGRETIPWPYLVAMVGFVGCLAGGLVIAKALPDVHPASLNGIGMLTGAALLIATSTVLGETKPLPTASALWAVQLYVVVIGSVGVFSLLLFVLRRWTASATSYQTVLSPPVTIGMAALLLGEPVSPRLLLGAAIIAVGVYVGVISHWHRGASRAG